LGHNIMGIFEHPVVFAIFGGIVVAIFTFLLGRNVFRPKHCDEQEEQCRKYIDTEVLKVMTDLIRTKHDIAMERDRSDNVFARSDVIIPQFKALRNDMRYIRRRIDQLAVDRKLMPVDIDPEED